MTDLRRFTCTIRVFDPTDGTVIAEHALPVDSPDAEHAVAATLSNAASFTRTIEEGLVVRAVAFACVAVEERR